MIQRSVFSKHWPSRNFRWLMLPPHLPLRERETFFAYSHHRAPLTTLHSVSRYCTSHLALPPRLSGSTRFLFCCYGNRPTVGIPIGDYCFPFLFSLIRVACQDINLAFSSRGNAWKMEESTWGWEWWHESQRDRLAARSDGVQGQKASDKGECCLFLLNNSCKDVEWISSSTNKQQI